ncbi:nucleotide-diphospho-sugar transferase [Pseudovirgaria hyperparasitica]|uniref:glycogenin glucosyltransferase n=1 Tax=Pseudovirgaria hyperparasitica TaxID=470096 RepID=A0A6A6W5F4_9PEZI|nr:nucleotide-diphospho-sugar transferase [Pseudovirgaria hyperparasitica]KAF2757833.1 nucleotide-diphospho-sugar transferase [Pseudovirgaria hyperparasitica]
MATMGEDVYCTLVMSDNYLKGAAVLAHSLRDAGTKKKLAALITLDTLSAATIAELKELFDYLITVDRIRNPNPKNLYLMDRADLSFAFTKIYLWRQTQFRKIVYLDADIVALRAPDELFEIDAPFAAAPDVGWPDAFNSGVMVLTPDMGEYWALQTMAASGDSFDGADQGLLNQYYEHRDWQRLSFTYNTTPNAQYQWEPAYRHYKRDIKMVHFIGKQKPWMKARQSASGPGVYNELLSHWWAVYDRHSKPPIAPPASHTVATAKESESDDTSKERANVQSEPVVLSPHEASPEGDAPPSIEEPLPNPSDNAEVLTDDLREERSEPKPREFSAPQMEWDATRSAPPAESRPEAMDFPVQQYTFNDSRQLFQPPKSYPEPPKDMWYEVPQEKPAAEERPKPIFPWEKDRIVPKATRVFADDQPSPHSTPWQSLSMTSELEVDAVPSASSTTHKSSTETWQSFNNRSVNAWDAVPGIENYIRSVMEQQSPRKNKSMAIQIPSTEGQILSPPLDTAQRRESLILTDFPTAIERPSLPVTPAPIRRPTFWGEERDETGALPAADGVPDQTDWVREKLFVCPQCGFTSHESSFNASNPPLFDSANVVSRVTTVEHAPDVSTEPVSVAIEEVEAPGIAQNEDAFESEGSSPPTSPQLLPLSLHPPPAYHYYTLPEHLRPVSKLAPSLRLNSHQI